MKYKLTCLAGLSCFVVVNALSQTLDAAAIKPCEDQIGTAMQLRSSFLREQVADYSPGGAKRTQHDASVSQARLASAQKDLEAIDGISPLVYAQTNPPYSPLYDLEGTKLWSKSVSDNLNALRSGDDASMNKVFGRPFRGKELELRLAHDIAFQCLLSTRLAQLTKSTPTGSGTIPTQPRDTRPLVFSSRAENSGTVFDTHTRGESAKLDRSKTIAGDGRSAMACVGIKSLASKDSTMSNGRRIIVNNCESTVEVGWCYVDTECSRDFGNLWTLGAGRSWPVSATREIRFGACYGADTLSGEKGTSGARFICQAPGR